MPRTGWISLNDYANRFKVSISTLRRRIRAGEVEHELEGGRYWMPNKPIEKYVRNREVYTPPPVAEIPTPRTSTSVGNDEALALTKNLLADLKSAYIHSLQEKEEQILQLKVENADLKTLVKILETQKTETPISAPDFDTEIESWS